MELNDSDKIFVGNSHYYKSKYNAAFCLNEQYYWGECFPINSNKTQ
jgi:hypothetical protein